MNNKNNLRWKSKSQRQNQSMTSNSSLTRRQSLNNQLNPNKIQTVIFMRLTTTTNIVELFFIFLTRDTS